MKFRLHIDTLYNGQKQYFPQRNKHSAYGIYDPETWEYFLVSQNSDTNVLEKVSFSSEEEAIQFIKQKKEDYQKNNLEIVKTEFKEIEI